jgi:cyanophycinase
LTPKGKILIIGGGEYKGDEDEESKIRDQNKEFSKFEILAEMIPEKKFRTRTIEIITTASRVPEEINSVYRKAFNMLGFHNLGFMNIQSLDDLRHTKWVDRINKAHTVFFSGGSQFRLATILGGSRLIEAIKERYINDKDFIIAGTSAGAMIMSALTIYEGGNNEALLKGEVKTNSGFHFFPDCIIDTHVIERGRFVRLTHAVLMNPICLGIGLGEDTALIITKGNIAECRGSGMVIIIDGRGISQTNIMDAGEDTPIYVESLEMHMLVKGCVFLLNERKFARQKNGSRIHKW